MKTDNTTPMVATEYDQKILKTIPYYNEFYTQTFSVIDMMHYSYLHWLDLGCGTGTLEFKAIEQFPEATFVMVDPSEQMIEQAKEKTANIKAEYLCNCSETIDYHNEFEVVTAIQSHHYLKEDARKKATQNVYEALRDGGIYITFENVIPEMSECRDFELQRWGQYQSEHGKSDADVKAHLARCGVNYFPITVSQHIQLLKDCGFRYIHVFWYSYMQMGIYGIK